MVATLLTEGVIDSTMAKSLTSIAENAQKSTDKDKICTAVNPFEAFKNHVDAQTGKKISTAGAFFCPFSTQIALRLRVSYAKHFRSMCQITQKNCARLEFTNLVVC